MLPYLINLKIYENLKLDDRLNFQDALNQIFKSEIPAHEKFQQYICPICALAEFDSIQGFCKRFDEDKYLVSKSIFKKLQRFSERLQYKSEISWRTNDSNQSSLEALIDHIHFNHLRLETRKVFQVFIYFQRSSNFKLRS